LSLLPGQSGHATAGRLGQLTAASWCELGEKGGKEKGCASRDRRQQMYNLEQMLEQLEHTSCRRQFKRRNYEMDKESLKQN